MTFSSIQLPYLSIVVTSRNDNRGDDMLLRMKIFIRNLDQQILRHKLHVELVFVEWNPPYGSPLLHEVLPSPCKGSSLQIRYIVVPNEIHKKWSNSENIPLFQMIAKNVGIRRARGRFILATNVDLLFSDELCQFLASEKLDPSCMYRANRCDVPNEILNKISTTDQLDFCKKNIIKRYGNVRSLYRHLMRMTKNIMISRLSSRPASSPTDVDTDACGDFTLMSNEAWKKIKGYPELGLYSIYIDGLGCHTAIACGYSQIVLSPDECTYHIEHIDGWASMSIGDKIIMMQKRPFLDYAVYNEAVHWIHDNKQPLPINNENWGYAKESFKEIVIEGNEISR